MIPALDRFIALYPTRISPDAVDHRNQRAARHLARMKDWRAWSYRDWQLARYLRDRERVTVLLPANPSFGAVLDQDSAARARVVVYSTNPSSSSTGSP